MFYPIAMSKNEISHPPKDMPAARVEFYKRLHEKRDNMETQELVREYKLKAQ